MPKLMQQVAYERFPIQYAAVYRGKYSNLYFFYLPVTD